MTTTATSTPRRRRRARRLRRLYADIAVFQRSGYTGDGERRLQLMRVNLYLGLARVVAEADAAHVYATTVTDRTGSYSDLHRTGRWQDGTRWNRGGWFCWWRQPFDIERAVFEYRAVSDAGSDPAPSCRSGGPDAGDRSGGGLR